MNRPASPSTEPRDIDWLAPLSLIMIVELSLAHSFQLGSLWPVYSLFAVAAALTFMFAAAFRLLFRLFKEGEQRPIPRIAREVWNSRSRIAFVVAGLIVVTMNACAITASKAHIQNYIPFYADPVLANLDRAIFGEDAWQWSHALFGWAFKPISAVYGTWLFGQIALVTILLFAAPSKLKTQALIARSLMWLLLGIVLAYALSSAGPVFYDQVYGGTRFEGLQRLIESDFATAAPEQYLWDVHQRGGLEFGSGISAMPSLHVAGATWLALVLAAAFPRLAPLGWIYVALIYVGSLITGWHYGLDGIVGVTGVVLIWKLAGQVANWRSHLAQAPAVAALL